MARVNRGLIGILAASILLASAPAVVAQQTREEERAAAQAEKAENLHPYEPTRLERRIQRLTNGFVNPPPVYAFVGSIFPGGLLAVGPGYRGRFAESGSFNVHAAWSLRNYKEVDGFVKLPDLAGGRVGLDLRANWLDAPKVAFFGVGNDSSPDDRTSFLYRAISAGGSARIAPTSFFKTGGGLDVVDIDTGPGTRGTSIERRFTASDAPGLDAAPTYVRSRLFADVDWRTSPDYTRRGGHYRIEWSDYHEISDGPFSFRRLDAEFSQCIPLLRENWVIAVRALASTTDTDAGQTVPFFLMPSLGGSRDLRGYSSWRFRDRHRVLMTGEYRWMAGQFVDMAIFVDAGKVAARRSDLDLNDLTTSYGIGARFHTPLATALRIELARTREGPKLVFAFGPVF